MQQQKEEQREECFKTVWCMQRTEFLQSFCYFLSSKVLTQNLPMHHVKPTSAEFF